jgi:signal transduction histidine kinase
VTFWRRLLGVFLGIPALMDHAIPAELASDPERSRRARLITRFGVLGSLFGFSYAIFYSCISHFWGAGIIVVCSSCVVIMPFIMRWKKSPELAGNFLALTLTLGFSALCFVEGGLHGHAIAWLSSVPLCALLLAGWKSARWWALLCTITGGVIAGLDLSGINLPLAFDIKWQPIVAATGFLGLTVFMFILGMIFEVGRVRAFERMREALSELAASNDRLIHLNKEKNEFLGIAAHDLKNPLSAIVVSAELLRTAKDLERSPKLISTIIAASTRMRDLISNLLNANAIEQGTYSSRLERCDVRQLVEQSVDNNQFASTRKNIAIRVGISEGLWARADKAATLQILDNLISNALKYSPPTTTMHVHTMPEESFIVISVRDEGPGISEADQKKLFQKFTRLSARPTGGESSTGLGLSIVKRLAESMGGSIRCHSTLGLGATFTLRLPVWKVDPAEPPPGFPLITPRVAPEVTPPPPTQLHSRN